MSMDETDRIFLEMKETSEFMVDLAYSALLYENKSLAEEVFVLEARVDLLNSKLQRLAVTQATKDDNVEKALVMIRLCNSIEVIADSAMEIADVVLRDIEPHPVIKQIIRESDTIITRVRVHKGSWMAGKTLKKMNLAGATAMWILAIRRNEGWLFDPQANETILGDDILIASGPIEGEADIRKMAH